MTRARVLECAVLDELAPRFGGSVPRRVSRRGFVVGSEALAYLATWRSLRSRLRRPSRRALSPPTLGWMCVCAYVLVDGRMLLPKGSAVGQRTGLGRNATRRHAHSFCVLCGDRPRRLARHRKHHHGLRARITCEAVDAASATRRALSWCAHVVLLAIGSRRLRSGM